jgi:hypothetical protein
LKPKNKSIRSKMGSFWKTKSQGSNFIIERELSKLFLDRLMIKEMLLELGISKINTYYVLELFKSKSKFISKK